MQPSIAIAGIIGLSILLSVSVYAFARLRIEQQRTIQKLVERGLSGDELGRAAGLGVSPTADLRRGLWLMAIGVGWAIVTFFIGGPAWKMGAAPVTLGAAYLLLWTLDGRRR